MFDANKVFFTADLHFGHKNLDNIDFIKEKQVAIGAYYYIYKGGSVIPVLYGPDYERNASEGIEIH